MKQDPEDTRFHRSARNRALRWFGVVALLATATWGGAALQAEQNGEAKAPPPPATRTDNVKDNYFGTEVADPYRWLEDQNAPETRKWIDEQNAYTDSLLDHLPGREGLEKQLSALLKTDAIGTPIERGGRYFFSKRLAAEDQSKIYVRNGLKGEDDVLIDPLPMSPDHSITVTLAAVSKDGKRLLYGVRQGGADEITPHFFDVDARRDLPDQFPKGRYFGFSILPDGSGCYYTRMTTEGPRVFRHKSGTNASEDAEVFGKGYGPEKIIASGLSDDGRWLLIHVLYGAAADRTEVYVKDVAKDGPVTPIINDLNARFFGEIAGGRIYLQTNWKAPKERILAVDLSHPQRDHWREVVGESDSVIEGFSAAGHHLGVLYTHNASSLLKLYDPSGKLVREISLPTVGSVRSFRGRWDSYEAFYSFQSFFVPSTVYRYDVVRGTKQVWARQNVPLDSSRFEAKQVWYTSKDGTRVPMFVAHKKGLKLDGANPTLLTAYGGFNVSETPSYSATAVTWMENGGVYAVANLRGGGEFGEAWHRAGMLEKKQNVFDDFIAAGEWLVKSHYTSSTKLAIIGASNGGLLVGAALTQRPDLFRAVVCLYPLLDMLRYEKFLVARFWVPEYGSAENRGQFKYLYAYSPYQNVKPGTKYPAVLFITGDSDTRVAPLHARKMAALLQAENGSAHPILLHYDTKAGHSGGTPVSKQVEDITRELSFLFWQLGAAPAASGHAQ